MALKQLLCHAGLRHRNVVAFYLRLYSLDCKKATAVPEQSALFIKCSAAARQRGLIWLQYHRYGEPDLGFRRLPLPWATVVVTLSDHGGWRLPGGEWQSFPLVALRGAATNWSEGYDAPNGQNEYLAALIEPWAVSGLFGIPAAELHNQVIDLNAVSSFDAASLYDRLRSAPDGGAKVDLLHEALLQRDSRRVPDPLIRAYLDICQRRAGAIDVSALLNYFGCSERKFRRSFQGEIGVLPKRWALLEKFAARVREMHPSSWGSKDEVPDAAYFDQAHEIHEFVRHTGITPGVYRKLKIAGDPRVFMIPSAEPKSALLRHIGFFGGETHSPHIAN